MNLSLSDIYFSKHEISIYDELFARLDPTSKGYISTNIINQLLNCMKISPDDQAQIHFYMNYFTTSNNFEKKDFYILIRFASIIFCRKKINKTLICKFDLPSTFIDFLEESIRKIVNAEKDKSIVLPPPPTKTKLKRVHTVTGACNNSSCDTANVSAKTSPQGISSSLSSFTEVHPRQYVSNCTSKQNNNDSEVDDAEMFDFWKINSEQKAYYLKQFYNFNTDFYSTIRGNVAKVFFEKSGLPVSELSSIWKLSDIDKDGALSLPEFCIAMHLVVLRRNKVQMPNSIPAPLLEIYNCLNSDGFDFKLDFDSRKSSINASDLAEQMRKNSINSDGQNITNKNWTQFNDSPVPSTSSCASPTHLTNFDYNVESIVKNPHIKHPVPLRLSPTSPSIAFEPVTKEACLSLPSENSLHNSGKTSNNVKTFADKSITGDDWHLTQTKSHTDLSTANNPKLQNEESITDFKEISDYLNSVKDNLIYRYKLPNEVNIPENFSNVDQLRETVTALSEYSTTLRKTNQEMFNQIVSLVKILYNVIGAKQSCRKCQFNLSPEKKF